MAFRDSGPGRFKIASLAGLQWAWSQISGNRDKFLAVGASIGLSVIGWMQDRVPSWALFEWMFFALVLSLAIYLVIKVCRAIGAWDYSQFAQGRFAIHQIRMGLSNPLKPRFHKERIKLLDLYHPHFRRRTNVTFEGCELVGPSNVVIQGGINFTGECLFDRCDIVIMREGISLPTALVFEDATFADCKFHAVMFFFTAADARAIGRSLHPRDGLRIVSDGPYVEI